MDYAIHTIEDYKNAVCLRAYIINLPLDLQNEKSDNDIELLDVAITQFEEKHGLNKIGEAK